MSTNRSFHTATLPGNGKVLVTGGDVSGMAGLRADLYDPATNTWASTGSMGTRRSRHTATLLGNGKVLVTGGRNGAYFASAELYDPATSTWTVATSMSTPRARHVATLLGNGKVLVAGGYSDSAIHASAELYTP